MKQAIIKTECGKSFKQLVAECATLEKLNDLLVGSEVGYGAYHGVVKEVVWG